MKLIYKENVIKAISLTKNFEQVDYVIEKIKTTDKINRRTKAGRELTSELLILTNKRKNELAELGEQPF